MTALQKAILLIAIVLSTGCGGAKKGTADAPEPPKPPIDEEVLDLVPYESDIAIWLDLKKIRASSVWGLVQKVFNTGGLALPEEEAIKNPLLTCDEIVMSYFDSSKHGNQLLVLVKGSADNIGNVISSFDKSTTAESLKVGEFDARRTPKLFLLSYTDRTIAFGNEAIVRMSTKTATKQARSLRENPAFKDFTKEGEASAKLRYRSGKMTPAIRGFKAVIPNLNSDAISGLDGELKVTEGLHVHLTLTTATQMDASVIARDLEKAKKKLSKNMITLLLGVEWLLEKLSITTENTKVAMDLQLDQGELQEVNQLLDRLQKIRELLGNEDPGPGSSLGGPAETPQ